MNYYVYYKVAEAQLPSFRSSIDLLFRTVKEKTGVQGRWMRRRDDASTYMEIYEGVQDAAAFEALLEQEGRKLGVERHVERFVDAS